ncbi:MAG: signal peptidase II [Paludibacteraceae bacterium]|nr:signal peptidase II [Paludibacteraceae bacterium]
MTLDISKKQIIALSVALFVIVVDQLIKYWVRLNLSDGSDIEVASWFKLCYVQNPGAAFGMTFGPKIFLTLFRIVAVGCLSYCTYRIIRRKDFTFSFVIAFVLITAGAAGNIIDCIFFAKIFDGGDWFVGKVVDMFYFPIIRTTWPHWVPAWSGEPLIFFRPVFNFADAAITCGTAYMLIFHLKELTFFMDLCSEKIEGIFSKKKDVNSQNDKNDENS